MQNWIEITMTTDRSFLPNLERILMDNKIKTWAEEDEMNIVHLKIYIPYFDGILKYTENLKKCMDVDKVKFVTREIKNENWTTSWQKFFDIIRIGKNFIIKPPWKEYTPQKGEMVIEIEPRMAFGTGYHPTTAGTLALVEDFVKPGMKILDMGCGSGILTIAASYLGASTIIGSDYDEICVRESKENYDIAQKKNPNMTKDVKFIFSDGFMEINGIFDAILLNVNTGFILDNVENIAKCLKPGGLFISGSIGENRYKKTIKAFKDNHFSIVKTIDTDGWAGIVLKYQ